MTRMIPIFPCGSIDEQAEFYGALGFTVTERQTRPNPYIALRHGGILIQFYGVKAHEPGSRFDTCYVLLDEADDIDALYAGFRAGLKATFGRVPTRGIPRVGPLGDMSYGVRQFLLTDPAGNQLRVGRPAPPPPPPAGGRLGRALATATVLARSREDPAAAARVLDPVLDDARSAPSTVRVRALVLRAEIAAALDDPAGARGLLAEVVDTPLTDAERSAVADDLATADDLTDTI